MSETPQTKTEKTNPLREKTETAAKLTDKQFDQSMLYAQLLHREIQAKGQFKEKLDGMARELSLDEKFGAYTADKIIREQYKLQYGEEPNAYFQRLLENEKNLDVSAKEQAYEFSMKGADYMESQDNPSFYRTFDRMANTFARAYEITEKKARSFIVQTYKEKHSQDYIKDYGKVEEQRIRTEKGLDNSSAPEQKAKPALSI